MKIVTLLPSATEMVCSLGLFDQLVGVTHECDFPSNVSSLPKITRSHIPANATSREIDEQVRISLHNKRALYSLDMTQLKLLTPDLIITQALCDVCAVSDSEVRSAACSLPGKPQVINLEPSRLDDVFECMLTIGRTTHCDDHAQSVVATLRERVDAVRNRSKAISKDPKRVVVLEWIDPLFSAGHWTPQLVEYAGGRECLGIQATRSVKIEWQQVRECDPEVMFVACCGFDVKRTMQDMPILESLPGYSSLTCVKNRQVHVIDGNQYLSRPGPRLVDSLEILASKIA